MYFAVISTKPAATCEIQDRHHILSYETESVMSSCVSLTVLANLHQHTFYLSDVYNIFVIFSFTIN